jgi:hypothetical protein
MTGSGLKACDAGPLGQAFGGISANTSHFLGKRQLTHHKASP